MFYVKNLPMWERGLRAALGCGGVVYAAMSWGTSTAGVGLGLVGAMLAVTGLIGFCPMCAMIGRKLHDKE